VPKQQDIPSQFSDDEMEQMKRYGAAQLGGTGFSEAVERELENLQREREANAAKMHAAQTGGGDLDLGPTQFQNQLAAQQGALMQTQAAAGARQAAQAQASQTSPQAAPAPSTAQGVSVPYPAQKQSQKGFGAPPMGMPEEGQEED
jgi:hypothetical protein